MAGAFHSAARLCEPAAFPDFPLTSAMQTRRNQVARRSARSAIYRAFMLHELIGGMGRARPRSAGQRQLLASAQSQPRAIEINIHHGSGE